MNKKSLLATRVALLVVLALSGSPAFAQKAPKSNPLLPDVHLGLGKLGVELSVVTPKAGRVVLPVLPSVSVPEVAVKAAPPLVPGTTVSANVGGGGVGASVGLPAVGGLTPPLDVGVNVSTGVPGPLQVGINAGAPGPGSPPLPETYGSPPPQGQLVAERRGLDQVPTCR